MRITMGVRAKTMSLLLIMTLMMGSAFGQITSISGTIRDARTQEPLPFANLVILGTRLGSTTNIDGYFFLGNMSRDSMDIVVSYIGYQTYRTRLYFRGEPHEILHIYLLPKTIGLREVVVEDSLLLQKVYRPNRKEELHVDSLITLIPDTLPIIVGYTIKLNPPRKWLRTTNDRIEYSIDEVPIFNTRHLYGIFQPFNLDAAKYIQHDVLGSNTRQGFTHDNFSNLVFNEGNRSGFQAQGRLGMLESNLTTSGPHPFGGSWYISGRRIDFDSIFSRVNFPTSNLLAPATPDYYFYELNGKITFDISDNTTASVSFLTSHDKLHWYGDADSVYSQSIWDDGILTARVQHRFSHQFAVHGNLFRTRYYSYLRGNSVPLWYNQTLTNALANELIIYGGYLEGEYFTGQNNILTGGIQTQVLSPTLNYADSSHANSDLSALIATYASYRHTLPGHFAVEGGLRATLNTGLSKMFWDPRMELIWQPSNVYAFNAHIGHYSTMVGEISMPTTIAQSILDVVLPYDQSINLPQNWLMGVGGSWTPLVGYDLQGRIFYSIISHPTSMDTSWSGNVASMDTWLTELQDGRRYGIEVVAERRIGNLTSLVHYELGQEIWRDINNFEFKAPANRTHRLAIELEGKISEKSGYSVGYRVASGKSYLDNASVERTGGVYNRLDGTVYHDFSWKSITGRVTFAIYNITNSQTGDLPVNSRPLTSQEDREYALLPFLPTVNFYFQF